MTTFFSDVKFALRSLARAKGLAITVIATLALGIGANAAIFTLVRGILLRPLANRDEDRLIYIRQSAKGLGADNANFSVPEIDDFRSRIKTISEFGDFSVIGFNIIGLGEPREIRAGVVGGSYFEVMGLHPVLGRLLDKRDDGPQAAGAIVLTHRFWMTQLHGDPSVLGKTLRIESYGPATSGTIVGVLEPSVPYPADTEIIANIVTSPHHLSATMNTGRVHRMTELFGRLAPGATLEQARADLRAVHTAMMKEHPEAYPAQAHFDIDASRLRDTLNEKARTILLVLMGASVLVFIIACSNVANLILARTVRRESELGIRAALGASNTALRRTLLAESLLLCGAGAAIGVLSAGPMVSILARYASRFSVRALDLTVDSSMLWVAAILAVVAAVLLAYAPKLPSAESAHGFGLAGGSTRITNTSKRQRVFAVTQIAASFLLLTGAATLLKTLIALQASQPGFETHQVLAINVPEMTFGQKLEIAREQNLAFHKECIRRISEIPGVDRVAVGSMAPWRDNNTLFAMEFSVDGRVHNPGEEDPRARVRNVSPGFFAALGIPLIEGRDFDQRDNQKSEPVVIVSQSLANRMFPGQDALGHSIQWTDPVLQFTGMKGYPRRIVGVVPDIEDERVEPGPAVTIYHPLDQEGGGDRLFIHAHGNPHLLVKPITQTIRQMSTEQVVEKAATLDDIRAEVLTPDRLNTIVFGGFAAVALLIAVVGVAGVLAFSVSGRIREFGIRLAIGSQPFDLMRRVIREGVVMAAGGVIAGALIGFGLINWAASLFGGVETPGIVVIAASTLVLLLAAVLASVIPAARAARVDVMQALRAE